MLVNFNTLPCCLNSAKYQLAGHQRFVHDANMNATHHADTATSRIAPLSANRSELPRPAA
jgi:hypothetical protein